jgi:hypothetical protein
MGLTVARHRLKRWPNATNTSVPAGTSLTPSGPFDEAETAIAAADRHVTYAGVWRIIISRSHIAASIRGLHHYRDGSGRALNPRSALAVLHERQAALRLAGSYHDPPSRHDQM